MCGISGYFLRDHLSKTSERILKMTRILKHRGPDDEGLVLIQPETNQFVNLITDHSVNGVNIPHQSSLNVDFPHQIAFGHRRFSIVDVSPAGHQPFWSRNQQVCVSFNGEIYNYLELRQELEAKGHQFFTHCDTEVLAEAYLEWGVDCFERFNGFWALSLYDTKKQKILLSRDRIGKVPLYVAQTSEGVFWSSEIKGILAIFKTTDFTINEQSIYYYITQGWSDLFHQTFYNEIVNFPNASYAWLNPDGSYEPQRFWQLPNKRLKDSDINFDETLNQFKTLLTSAIQLRMRADVPVGFQLSGGMDSSSLVALSAQSGYTLKSFTVAFPDSSVDEEPFARKVAEQYSNLVDYIVIKPPKDEFFEQANDFVWLLEEPFHSPNVLTNQGILKIMAQQGIKVSISGAAGDEVLAGYASDYHSRYLRWLLQQGKLSTFGREFALFSENNAEISLKKYLVTLYRLLPFNLRVIRQSSKVISSQIDPFLKPSSIDILFGPSDEIEQRLKDIMGDWRMNYWMRAGNKSSLGVPMEVRAPFLDYRIIDFAFTLPLNYLIRDGWMKWILRQSVKDILPNEVVWRKVKMGFPFPYTEWLNIVEERFFNSIGYLDCPYLNLSQLKSSYQVLTHQNPLYLWRLMSLALWWKRCVLGESLL